ncbi:10372_t:CDS:1, partial [Dentiscutata erythropus]
EDGMYMFRIQGEIYYSIGSLFPDIKKPKFLQLYIYNTEHETNNQLAIIPNFHKNTLELIKEILNQFNSFMTNFRSIATNSIDNLRLIIKADHSLDQRIYNTLTASQVAAVWINSHDPVNPTKRNIIVKTKSRNLQYISEMNRSYNLIQYPLFFPRGDYRWNLEILQNASLKKVTTRQYYTYKLHIHENSLTLIHHGRRLLQQYIVDNYVKIESERLNYLQLNQDKL